MQNPYLLILLSNSKLQNHKYNFFLAAHWISYFISFFFSLSSNNMAKELNAAGAGRRNSNTQILEELEALSESLYESHKSATARRTASLALPRTTTLPSADHDDPNVGAKPSSTKPWSRRMSLSPWRSSRPKPDNENIVQKDTTSNQPNQLEFGKTEKKGLWNWKPIRALSHIGMQKLSCLLSVEVVTAQGLPASMNGLRLSVCVRKKETKDGAVNTMPSRVQQGAADFEETLFIRCHVYCSNYGNGKYKQQLKFEPRPFLIYLFAVDAEELDFGRNTVDLSLLIQESVEKSYEGTRVRQWDLSFNLLGKAKGGELIVKLGFQMMEKDGGIGIYNQGEGLNLKSSKSKNFSFARKQSKASFSVPSPRIQGRSEAWTSSQKGGREDLQELDDLNLDEPAPAPAPSSSASIQKPDEPGNNEEIVDFPDFEVVDKGVEIDGESESEDNKSSSKEVVKEIVHHDQLHLKRLTELDSIAQQIKALESMMGGDEKIVKAADETESQRLDADEETVTREFLQMLEGEGSRDFNKLNQPDIIIPPLHLDKAEDSGETEGKVYLQDLGKGLGCVVQTRDGGYLAAANPFDSLVPRTDTPKLAMQMSKPMVVPSDKTLSGFELFQKMAAVGLEKLSSQILSLMPPLDEIVGKTAEQIAFEGIASSIIQGRNKEASASSSAARTIAAVKSMAKAMRIGRKERIATGIWNVNETPLTAEEILAFSLQKIEGMTVEALKVQADMAEEEAPFDVSAILGKKDQEQQPFDSAIPLENWIKNYSGDQEKLTLAVVVQLRDPLRRYEAVGGPVLALIHASSGSGGGGDINVNKYDDEEKRFKVTSLHVGGLKVRTAGKRNIWDSERHRLTAMQWLVAYGLGKSVRKGKQVVSKGSQDFLWSISSRVMADMWLKTMRNPDVKFAK